MSLKRTIFAVLPVICAVMCMGFSDDEIRALMSQQQNNEMRYRVSGSFVDENNNALTNVKATIRETQNMWSGESISHKQTFDSSSFTITSGLCQQMSVRFYKDGYYPVYIGAKGIFDYIDGNAPLVDNNIIVSPPCTVALEAIGPITPNVDTVSISLTIQRNGPDIELQYITFPFVDKASSEYRQKDYVNSESQLPPSTIYVWPTFSADGKIEAARMVTSIPDSGFIVKSDIENNKDFIRKMKEAPEAGYSASIIIPTTNIDSGNDCYFYVKIGNMYGKGNLFICETSAYINLYLNKDMGTADSRRINPDTF